MQRRRRERGRNRWVRVGISGVVFCGSVGAVSSSIYRLLLLSFHASRILCCVCYGLVYLPPLFFSVSRLIQDYVYDHCAYIYINTITRTSFDAPSFQEQFLISPEALSAADMINSICLPPIITLRIAVGAFDNARRSDFATGRKGPWPRRGVRIPRAVGREEEEEICCCCSSRTQGGHEHWYQLRRYVERKIQSASES